MKEFYLNIDLNFYIPTYLDAQSLIEEMLGGDPWSFIEAANVVLDMEMEIAKTGLLAKDGPPLSSGADKDPSPSFTKPSKAARSKTRKKK